MKNIIFIGLLFISSSIFAQCNLVKNPSFELYQSEKPPIRINKIKHWELLKDTEGGYVHEHSPYFGYRNARGSQLPKDGKGYLWLKMAGLYIGEYHNFGDISRSYVQTELKTALQKDSVYQVSFWVSFAEKSNLAINKLGAYFSENPIDTSYVDFIQFYHFPQVQHKTSVLLDPTTWIEVAGEYKAKGGERYLTLGHFGAQYDFDYEYFKGKGHFPEAFYFIDHVAVKASNAICDKLVNPFSSIEIKSDTLLVFPQVQFATASAALADIAFPVLNELAQFLKKNNRLIIEVQGHTDNIGTPAANLVLSKERALTVARYLRSKGIHPARIYPVGYGDTKPVTENETEAGRTANRRVLFLIKKRL